jgi:hypothetical protein
MDMSNPVDVFLVSFAAASAVAIVVLACAALVYFFGHRADQRLRRQYEQERYLRRLGLLGRGGR